MTATLGPGDYQRMARQVAAQYGIDPEIFARQIGTESNWNPRARSHAGAMGLGQLMPGTAKDLGVTDPWNPMQNLDGAARYMRQQLDRFGGNYSLALAAYNAGPGAVMEYNNSIPPYKETQGYVAKILENDIDPRMAGGEGGPAVSPYSMPDKGVPPYATPGFNPYLSHPMAFPPESQGSGGQVSLPPELEQIQQILNPSIGQQGPGLEPTREQRLWALADLWQPKSYRTGALESLSALADPYKQAEMQQKLERNRLYNAQLMLEKLRFMGMQQPSQYQQWQNEYWRAQEERKRAELKEQTQTRLQNTYDRESESYKPYTITYPDGRTETRVLNPMEARQLSEKHPGLILRDIGRETAAGRSSGKAGKGDASSYEAQLAGLEELMTELDANPAAQAGLGTPGSVGSVVTAAAGIVDQLTGRKFKEAIVKKFFGGMDPRILKGRLQAAVLPVARLMVDQSGPLSETEQRAARRLLGILESGDGILDSNQAYELLVLTNKALQSMQPPEMQKSPPQGENERPSKPPGEGWTWHEPTQRWRRPVTP